MLAAAILTQQDLRLSSAVARSTAGTSVGLALNCDCAVKIRSSVVEALSHDRFDVLVDYTSARAAFENARAAVGSGVHVVVGSSGITADQLGILDGEARARRVGILTGNFAITAVLAQMFACHAARFVDSWEIIEYASQEKIDAPSGTARELASRLSKVTCPKQAMADSIVGDARARGAPVQGSQIHSIRLPGFVSAVEIILGRSNERLLIRHEAVNCAEPYVDGTLAAIRNVSNLVGVSHGLESVLELL